MSMRAMVHTFILSAAALGAVGAQAAEFHLQEATIESIQQGIRSGEVTCKQVVEGYVARARAYNGICAKLVTADGAKVPKALGTVRAGAALKFPTDTIAIAKLVPDFDKYKGLSPDFGRMEPTMSNPAVQQQYGMVAGVPNAGQVNALETLNIRGERSVTCKGKFDAHPSSGPLPPGAPAACEEFRQQPDALERAAELDKQYGRNPDTQAMPLYCAPMSFKAVYDAKDMRSTGGGDVNYAMDAAPVDSTLTGRMRAAGAIIYAQAHNSEYNAGSGDPGGAAKVERPYIGAGGSRESWGGMTCNPYDTERVTSGSSGGSAVSVASNLVVCSICETTGGSCRGPANFNNVVNIVPTKGMISYGGGIGANPYQDRPGIHRELQVLQDLGAEVIETIDPQYPDDPAIPNMAFTFNDAFAEVLPFHMPEIFSWKKDGKPEFEVPGYDVTSRKYLVSLATHQAPLPANMNFRRVFGNPPTDPEAVTGYTFAYQFGEYLTRRGDSRVYDWQTLNANAKYYNDVRRAAMKNWENKEIDIRTNAITYIMKRRDTLRMAMMKVLEQNKIDVFVNPVSTTLQGKIGGASVAGGGGGGFGYGAMLGIPEVFVPAGFADSIYDLKFVLSKDGTKYEGVEGTEPTKLASPLPYNIAFWAGPGEESTLLKVASAYEAATHHRKAPPAFGPVKGEP